MGERFLVRKNGGPIPGDHVAENATWPLPDTLPLPEPFDSLGCYRKVSESRLSARPENSHVIRGAEYDWVPAGTSEGTGERDGVIKMVAAEAEETRHGA